MTPSPIVSYVGRRAVPFIQLYALYVLGHGEDGPGGGFQGGVIFASSFVLLVLIAGWAKARKEAPASIIDPLTATGCLVYAGIGMICLLLGGAFLQYEALAGANPSEHAKHSAHHFGLIGIELGVMITVTASMITLYFEMARPRDADDEEADEDSGQAAEEGSDA